MKKTWTTKWDAERRLPSFATDDPAEQLLTIYGTNAHYIWGNVFAYDCLNVSHNEGLEQNIHDLAICFAGTSSVLHSTITGLLSYLSASGDFRNLLVTVNALPDDFGGKLRVILNDRDSVVTARNAFILFCLQTPDFTTDAGLDELAEICFHLTYSAALTEGQYAFLTARLDEFLGAHKSQLGPHTSFVRQFQRLSVSISLGKFLDMARSTYDLKTARRKMLGILLAPSRVDHLHRELWALRPSHRAAEVHYRETGVVLPFGAATSHFNHPNRCAIHLLECINHVH